MSISDDFVSVMRRFAHTFMNRSVQDMVRFAKEHDLSMGQHSVLMRLYHADRCGVGEVGSQLGITNAAASQLVDKLVQQGCVERAEDPDDRRVKRLTLTPSGRQLVELGFEARLKWTAALPEVLPHERCRAIMRSLEDLIAAADGLEQPAPQGEQETHR